MNTKQEYREMVEKELEFLFPENDARIPETLLRAIRYSLLAGGKRLRPIMLLAATDMLGGDVRQALVPACCVEMIHTYSLIHDDLPGMDDDTLRRGRPTSHIMFGEGQAILAGDALLSAAFERMLENALRYPAFLERHVLAMSEIARGAGPGGMIAGQSQDLLMETREGSEADLLYIHTNKTARMFIHPLRAGGCIAGADTDVLKRLGDYGYAFGMLFQTLDDILDETGTLEEMGKNVGKDREGDKLTAVKIYGMDGAKARCEKLLQEGLDALSPFGARAEFFRALISETATRRG
ncbi:MAG: polyprenyl synthetase family protein [Christensenellales bacterium]|jgi:geranylgeranyl diphosphate synthase type II